MSRTKNELFFSCITPSDNIIMVQLSNESRDQIAALEAEYSRIDTEIGKLCDSVGDYADIYGSYRFMGKDSVDEWEARLVEQVDDLDAKLFSITRKINTLKAAPLWPDDIREKLPVEMQPLFKSSEWSFGWEHGAITAALRDCLNPRKFDFVRAVIDAGYLERMPEFAQYSPTIIIETMKQMRQSGDFVGCGTLCRAECGKCFHALMREKAQYLCEL